MSRDRSRSRYEGPSRVDLAVQLDILSQRVEALEVQAKSDQEEIANLKKWLPWLWALYKWVHAGPKWPSVSASSTEHLPTKEP
jgi:hypothetical protein